MNELNPWLNLIKLIYSSKIKCYFCDSKNAGRGIKGNKNKILCIHHIDGNPSNDKINNLVVLCCRCHKKLHIKIYKRLKIKIYKRKKFKYIPSII